MNKKILISSYFQLIAYLNEASFEEGQSPIRVGSAVVVGIAIVVGITEIRAWTVSADDVEHNQNILRRNYYTFSIFLPIF